MAIVLSIANNKGGVGKTTTALSLAEALGRLGKRVAFVDMDTQCNSTEVLLPSDFNRIENSLEDILDPHQDLGRIFNVFYTSTCKGVTLIPNVEETAMVERDIILEGAKGVDSYNRFRLFIRNQVAPHYDFVIADCPPNMGTLVLISLMASDFVLVPVRATSSKSVVGLVKMIRMIKDMQSRSHKEGGNPELKFLKLLINGADRRKQITKNIITNIRETFGSDVFKTEIPVNSAFEDAESENKTIFQYDSSSPGARAYRALAKELIEVVEEESDSDLFKSQNVIY